VVRTGRAEPFRVVLGAPATAATPPAQAENALAPSEGLDEPAGGAAATRHARVGGQLVTVAADPLLEAAARPPAGWRSRAWTSFAVYEIDRVELTGPEGAITLARADGDWTRSVAGGASDVKIFYGPVSDLLAALTEARAERVIEATAAAQGGAAGRPALTVKLRAGEGETAREQTLTLSGPGAGGELAGRASDRQAVLVLPGALLADLRAKVAAVGKAEPLQPAPTASPAPAE
jgi:hypothetical protein